MTNETILTKAIEKAVRNGMDEKLGWGHPMFNMNGKMVAHDLNLLFSHNFAKAFWKEDKKHKNIYFGDGSIIYNWQYYLQEMVLEEEPLKYIEKFL